MKIRQKIVLTTALFAFFFLAGGVVYKMTRPGAPLRFSTQGHPVIGSGKMELVIFEDLRCTHCRTFTEQVFPKLAETYVGTGKARLVFIPIAFDEESKPMANAALIVYRIAPARFLPFVLELSRTQASMREDILELAKKVGDIPLSELAERMDHRIYYGEIEHNLLWARSLMGEEFGTPTLLINGIETPTASFEEIDLRIVQLEKKS